MMVYSSLSSPAAFLGFVLFNRKLKKKNANAKQTQGPSGVNTAAAVLCVHCTPLCWLMELLSMK